MLWLVMTRLSDVVYRLKRTVPMTDPCGTPNGIYLGHDREPDMSILWYRFDKKELNHRSVVPEILKCLCTRSKSMSRSIVSNTAERPSKVSAVNFSLSMLHAISLSILRRAASVE